MLNNPYTQATFLKSAAKVQQLPAEDGYEVAFAGRSNAGKSSALNCLTGNKHLARTSKTPGRTQLLNVFIVKDEQHRLVDLPGYGYAKVAMQTKIDWQKNLAHYLEVRESLKGLVLLMDIRHPMKELDKTLLHWAITQNLPVHILLTKADKLSHNQVQLALQNFATYGKILPNVTWQPFSSLKKQGVETLVNVLNTWFEWS